MTGAPTILDGYDESLLGLTLDSERRHFWYRARREIIAAAVARLPAPRRVLEVGCGNGNVVRDLAWRHPSALAVASDALLSGLQHARVGVVGAVCSDAAHLPWRPAFDLVLLCDVIEHLEDDRGALEAAAGVLVPGGRVLVTVPAQPRLWSDFDVASGHQRRYTDDDLVAVLGDAGLTVELVTPFMGLLAVAARLRRRGTGPASVDPDACIRRELQVVRGVNGVLFQLLRQEKRLIRRGRRLPGGTSLLALARRQP